MIDSATLFEELGQDPRPVLISGPTASGKSALALALAERFSGVVINADALQVYRDWRILTARPTPADEARAPHALYGHVDAARADYSAGAWLRDVGDLLATAGETGARAIIVGGPSLYFNALTRGLAEIPALDPAVRAEGEARLAADGVDALLVDIDPRTLAGLDRRNPRRVLRAWEILRGTGRGQADWAAETPPPLLPVARARALKIETPVERLDARIAERFERMVETGAMREVAAVNARGLDPASPAMRAVGAAELLAYRRGDLARSHAIEAGALATRRLAKRQRTWMRNQMADWTPVRGAQ